MKTPLLIALVCATLVGCSSKKPNYSQPGATIAFGTFDLYNPRVCYHKNGGGFFCKLFK